MARSDGSPKAKWAVADVGRFLDYMKTRGTAVSKVAVIYEDGPYGQSVADNYKALFAAKNIAVVADDSFRPAFPISPRRSPRCAPLAPTS